MKPYPKEMMPLIDRLIAKFLHHCSYVDLQRYEWKICFVHSSENGYTSYSNGEIAPFILYQDHLYVLNRHHKGKIVHFHKMHLLSYCKIVFDLDSHYSDQDFLNQF